MSAKDDIKTTQAKLHELVDSIDEDNPENENFAEDMVKVLELTQLLYEQRIAELLESPPKDIDVDTSIENYQKIITNVESMKKQALAAPELLEGEFGKTMQSMLDSGDSQ